MTTPKLHNILMIDSSDNQDAPISRQLSHAVLERVIAKHLDVTVTIRDLNIHPLPHLHDPQMVGLDPSTEAQSPAGKEVMRRSNEVISEVLSADTIILGVALNNFSIPSALQVWIDYIARAGRTFRYTADGIEGLIHGKKIYLAIASRKIYTMGHLKAFDFGEPYLVAALGIMGMTDVTVFRVEDMAVPVKKGCALEMALKSVQVKFEGTADVGDYR